MVRDSFYFLFTYNRIHFYSNIIFELWISWFNYLERKIYTREDIKIGINRKSNYYILDNLQMKKRKREKGKLYIIFSAYFHR